MPATETKTNDVPQGLARWAGLLYLVIIVTGIWGAGFARGGAIIAGDAAATAANILASEGVFFVSIAADIVMVIADVALAVVLFTLFAPVSRTISAMAAAFRLTQAATITASLLALWAGTVLVYGDPAAIGATREQIDILALGLISMHGVGYDLGLVFFAVNSFLMGYLIVKSGFVPRIFGWLIVAAGAVYLTGSTFTLFIPDRPEIVDYLYAIPVLAEAGIALWLTFRGVNARRWIERSPQAVAA